MFFVCLPLVLLAMSKAENTKAYLIEKSAPVFNTKSYTGVSRNDMTEAAGLTKGGIYWNIANKDELALAVFDHNWTRIRTILKSEISKKSSFKANCLFMPMFTRTCKILCFIRPDLLQ